MVAESIVALVPVIAFAVRTEFAIFVMVALSPNALSKFIKSTDNCLISPESAVSLFACKVLCAELSRVALSTVN